MLPIRNISYLLPMCCSFWQKCKNSPKTALGCSTPLSTLCKTFYLHCKIKCLVLLGKAVLVGALVLVDMPALLGISMFVDVLIAVVMPTLPAALVVFAGTVFVAATLVEVLSALRVEMPANIDRNNIHFGIRKGGKNNLVAIVHLHFYTNFRPLL